MHHFFLILHFKTKDSVDSKDDDSKPKIEIKNFDSLKVDNNAIVVQ